MSVFNNRQVYIACSKGKRLLMLKKAKYVLASCIIVHRWEDSDLVIAVNERISPSSINQVLSGARAAGIEIFETDENLTNLGLDQELNRRITKEFIRGQKIRTERIRAHEYEL